MQQALEIKDMTIEALIKQKIMEEFNPTYFELINESHKHIGHAGHDGSGDSHFKLIVASEALDGYSRVQAHRKINNVVKPLFDLGLHAFSIELRSSSSQKA